jgi:hypothetical protein
MADEPSTKRCPKCETVRPLHEFGVDRTRREGVHFYCRHCINAANAARRLVTLACKGRDTVNAKKRAQRAAYRAARKTAEQQMSASLEALTARVAALEALLRQTHTIDRIAPDRPRRKRAVHEHASPGSAAPSATQPVIRTIADILAHDGVTRPEAKRIQEAEILARAEWRPSITTH